ncbi:MAG: XdhC family protein [Sciscionella sp.]
MSQTDLLHRVDALRAGRTPFVLATVVRAEPPTSSRPGDRAVLHADGTVEGFVGGSCAESTVRSAGLRLLAAGSSTLLRITPGPSSDTAVDGLLTVGNPCASGGTLDIFLETMLPPLLVHVYGDAPVARSLVAVGTAIGYEVHAAAAGEELPRDLGAVLVATHGRGGEDAVLTAALRAEIGYIGLIASPKRGRSVLAALEVGDAQRARVSTPAGLDIGARTPGEIAVSVFAELLEHRPRRPASIGTAAPVLAEALDPVCGMAVAVSAATLSREFGARTVYFCGAGCLRAFDDDPRRYTSAGDSRP